MAEAFSLYVYTHIHIHAFICYIHINQASQMSPFLSLFPPSLTPLLSPSLPSLSFSLPSFLFFLLVFLTHWAQNQAHLV